MKKVFLIFSIISCVMTTFAQTSFYVYKTDGSATKYLINDVDSISFVAPTTSVENGYDYVDLGLPSGLKWATCNVGATNPEEYGNYYACGETTPKSTYSWSTYKWCNGSYDTMTKYCTNSDYGTVDNKKVLDKEDDAASVNMGGSWRMPTRAEQDELRTECTWIWTTLNGVNGYNVEGPNGNSIFLPAAGYRNDSGLNDKGSYGYYWSSSLLTYDSCYAYYLIFNSDDVYWNGYNRCSGRPVRGVCP